MKLYSDVLDAQAVRETAQGTGVWINGAWPIGAPKLRKAGWTIKTEGNSGRWKNTGNRGASELMAASWDAHGRWFANLFARDPKALVVGCGRYNGVEDFHAQTKGKYREPVPGFYE